MRGVGPFRQRASGFRRIGYRAAEPPQRRKDAEPLLDAGRTFRRRHCASSESGFDGFAEGLSLVNRAQYAECFAIEPAEVHGVVHAMYGEIHGRSEERRVGKECRSW